MDFIQAWCQNNYDIVQFLYGMIFLVMGIIILLQRARDSKFEIANILWLLGAFAIFHAINEFQEMWEIIRGYVPYYLVAMGWFAQMISLFLLFEFGSKLFQLAKPRSSLWHKKAYKLLTVWLTRLIWFFIFLFTLLSRDFLRTSSIWAKYLFCFPAGILISLGLKFYYKDLENLLKSLKVKKYFFLVGVSFLFYGFLGGLIVPKGDFFPANMLNTESFISIVRLPVQAFRAICAIIATAGIVGMFRIFNWESEKRFEDALMVREKITEGIDEAIILIDNDFRVIWANKRAKAIYGELIGECYYYEYATHYALPQERGDPKKPINACPIVDVLTTDGSQTMLHTFVDEKGEENYAEVSAYPIRDEQHNIIEFVHVARDVTERIRAEESLKKAYSELKKAQQELIQSEKLASLGRFSLGVAHEVKNPLAIILSGVEFLELKCQNADPDLIKATGAIKDAVFRADEIVKRLLKFSRPEQLTIERISPVDLINEALAMFKYSTPLANIEIKTDFSAEEMYIEVDKNQIQQVIFNLVMNSIEAMPGGGELKIRTSKEVLPEFSEASCVIEVRDTGEGITKENLSRVFEPFFTTKRDIRGTGLGLSISRTIVNNHNGELIITSEPKKWTSARIVLPLV